jgi:DNA invertase Pin-like site-specific DNA recombinase
VSLDAQLAKVQAYCTMRGFEVAEVIRDEGVSGYKKALKERPGGAALLALVQAGAVRHVVAVKVDRLFRDAEDCLHETKAWDRGGVSLHLVDLGGQAVDTSSPNGRMFLTIMASVAEWERGVIAERTAEALHHMKGQGQVYGHTPFGYKRRGDALVRHPGEQKALRVMQSLRAGGATYAAIALALREQEVPTKKGGTWAAFTVYRVLNNSLHQPA